MSNNWKNMDTTNCNLDKLIENVRSHIKKFDYNVYKKTEEYVFFSKEKLTIREINAKRCELKREDHHYYW